ncbi:SPOR domain-containing protein [Psychroserpens sp. NJDZ02]|uniref:SPOR domain-containing protein n=1 Tax=Psychroserpens sp. NJDZ02 TaxID=2570561 RepID=UPI0010A7E692|nr:SPOR domain-containing protein [Psychroserpens sp. NJDZ02]QCE41577.1 SPOR domain-containing protein [Psychroserpens sp. NJDZ02]
MKKIQIKTFYLTALITIGFSAVGYSQQGTVILNEDPTIANLLKVKKEINSNEKNSDRYKIQIYSGNLGRAESTKSNFNGSVGKYSSQLVFEAPDYKVWVGSFRSRLEADRALVEVQKKFRDAFIFKPLKEKN